MIQAFTGSDRYLPLAQVQSRLGDLNSDSNPEASSGGSDAACSAIGNNLAAPSYQSNEAATLILLRQDTGNTQQVVDAINGQSEVIVRLGAGEDPPTAANAIRIADGYINALRNIDADTDKPFLVQAGTNEANCAEFVPLSTERTITSRIVGAINSDDITFISPQVDYYCDVNQIPGDDTYVEYVNMYEEYVSGISYPFYVGPDVPTDDEVGVLRGAMAPVDSPLYITESGPFIRGTSTPDDDQFQDYVTKLADMIQEFDPELVMLFNSLGINPDPNFAYTERFHSTECREALQTRCTNTEYVMERCGGLGDRDPYFLYPIDGITPGDNFDPDAMSRTSTQDDDQTRIIKRDLVHQGYQALCSTPKLDLEVMFGGDEEAFRAVFGPTNSRSDFARTPVSQQIVDLTNIQVPNFRGSEESIFDSLEQYYAHYNREENTQTGDALNSGPLFFATSLEQQCKQKKQILSAAHNLCQMLEDPTRCALNKPIPDTNFSWESLYQETKNTNYCDNISDNRDSDAALALKNVPLYLHDAYRLGFLVVSAELTDARFTQKYNFLREEGVAGGEGVDCAPSGNFLATNTGDASCFIPKHAVRIFAFRLPDIAMNRDLHKEDNPIHYNDATQLTRNLLLSKSQQSNYENEFVTRRNAYLDAVNAKVADDEKKVIDCQGQPSCDTPLGKALVDMINAGITADPYATEGDLCGANKEFDPLTEDSGDIAVPGGIGESPDDPEAILKARESLNNAGVYAKNNEEEDDAKVPGSEFSFLNVMDLNPNNQGNDKAQINAYLVTPQGEELGAVEETLASFFMSAGDQAYRDLQMRDGAASQIPEEDRVPRFWELGGAKYTHTTPKAEFTFTAPPPYCGAYTQEGNLTGEDQNNLPAITESDAQGDVGEEVVIPGECRISGELSIIDKSRDPNQEESLMPRILGGGFGWVTHRLQQSLFPRGSNGWDYYQSCETTQDFLLGRCGNESETGPGDGAETSGDTLACLGAENSVYTPEGATEQERLDNVKDLVRQVARETDTPPDLLWGVLNIEGSPFLRRVRAGQPFECAELVNSCGAVGPMQIIHGGCYQANGGTCSSGLPPSAFEALDRSPEAIGSNICNIKEALTFAAEDYLSNSGRFASYTPEQRAGLYHGYGGASADGSEACGGEVQGCNGLNYCECATQGFSL